MPAGRRSDPRRRPMRDALRLIHLGDVLYQLGNLLYKRSLRFTLLTVGIALLGYGANFLGMTGFTVKQAVTLPLLVGGSSLLGGLLLKAIPAILAARQMTIAQASDLNLMEDYRKARSEEHLARFWERIYRFEQEDPAEFLERARQALLAPLPQTRQRYELGLDLHLLEDWYDGAYFDRSDEKLVQQYAGDAALLQARRNAGLTFWASLGDLPSRIQQRLWFLLTTRAVAIHVADAVERSNHHWDTTDFNAQALLWPGEEDAHWLTHHEGAREEILSRRAKLVKRCFGRREARTRQMLDRLFGPNLRLATRLRLRYDAEYALGILGYTPHGDLDELAWDPADPLRRFVARYLEEVGPALTACRSALEQAAPSVPAEIRRAALVLWHDRHHGRHRSVPALTPDTVKPWLELAEEQHERVTHLLILVRQHHELARLERQSYHDLVEALRASTAP